MESAAAMLRTRHFPCHKRMCPGRRHFAEYEARPNRPHRCISQEYVHCYHRKFDFRYNTRELGDVSPTLKALLGKAGMLMYSGS